MPSNFLQTRLCDAVLGPRRHEASAETMRSKIAFEPGAGGKALHEPRDVVPAAGVQDVQRADDVGDRALFDNVQAVAFQTDDGAAAVGQQNHVLHTQVEQDLSADAVIAELSLRPRGASGQQSDPFSQCRGPVLANPHHDASAGLAGPLRSGPLSPSW